MGVVVHRTWLLSQFLSDNVKNLQIFALTVVSGLCLITNVFVPFVVVGLLIAAVELRSLLANA
jgi:hypothetical protein